MIPVGAAAPGIGFGTTHTVAVVAGAPLLFDTDLRDPDRKGPPAHVAVTRARRQNPAVNSPAGPPPAKRGIIVGAAAVAAAAAVVAGVVIAGRDDGGTRPAAGPATSGPATAASTPAANADSGSPTPGTSAAATAPAPSTPGTPGTPVATTAAATVAMPDLVGKNAAAARIELERLGFGDVRFGSQDTGETSVVLPQNWTVTRQSAAAGARVPTTTAIVLTCTRRV